MSSGHDQQHTAAARSSFFRQGVTHSLQAQRWCEGQLRTATQPGRMADEISVNIVPLFNLPEDVLVCILSSQLLEVHDLLRFSRSCRTARSIVSISATKCWQRLYLQHFGQPAEAQLRSSTTGPDWHTLFRSRQGSARGPALEHRYTSRIPLGTSSKLVKQGSRTRSS